MTARILSNKKLHAFLKDLRDGKMWFVFYYKGLPVYAKLLTQYAFVVPRKDWKVGKEYEQGDYVLTSTNKIYKCMLAGEGKVTKEPNLVISDVFRTEDNYCWKFWDTLRLDQSAPFMTATELPLVTYNTEKPNREIDLLSILDGSKGALIGVDIVDGGSGYLEEDYDATLRQLQIFITSTTHMPEGVGKAYVNWYDNANGQWLATRSRYDLGVTLRHQINQTASSDVTVIGDGYGAEVSITTNPYNGRIIGITIVGEGTDYTYMNLKATKTGGDEAILKAHITPTNDTKWDDCKPMLYAIFQKNTVKADFIFDEAKIIKAEDRPNLNYQHLSMAVVLDTEIDVQLEDVLEITKGRETTSATVLCKNGKRLRLQVASDNITDYTDAKINNYNANVLSWEKEVETFEDGVEVFGRQYDTTQTLDSDNVTSYKIVISEN